ncbi:MAG: hypothetical protein KA368_03295 [Acidobacteria bacterium]|nr:hypothetical protein [Acidobacteriota bacterium]
MVKTIDEVIAQLTAIIEDAIRRPSRLGYFAALYRKVTIRVKEGIQQGRFQNGERMERLDVNFANRYLTAYEQHKQGLQPSESWQLSFESAEKWRPLILQDLLIGINAHINLDLGIAAQGTCPGDELPSLKQDFETINTILAELVQPVQNEIGDVSPWIRFLEKIDPSANDAIINFSMRVARNSAWNFALRLNSLDAEERSGAIQKRDHEIAELGRLVIYPPGVFFKIGLFGIRLRESNDIPQVIEILS